MYLFCNVNLLVVCYIYKFLFHSLVIYQFSSFVLIYLFYLRFANLMFYFQILCFISHYIYKFLFCLLVIRQFINFILIYLFYLLFKNLIFHFLNLHNFTVNADSRHHICVIITILKFWITNMPKFTLLSSIRMNSKIYNKNFYQYQLSSL